MSRQFISPVDVQKQGQLPDTGRIEGGVSGLAVYQNSQHELAYFYLPLAIIPQQQADGRPMVNLMAIGDGGYLNFNARWRASDEQLVALRGHIASMLELDQPDELMLTFAPVKSVKFNLFLMQEEDADTALLGHSSSNGSPPYSSIFNLKLSSQQFELISQVLAGQSGLLGIQLESEWHEDELLEGKLEGDLDLRPLLDIDQAGPDLLLNYLLEKIASGVLTLTLETALTIDSPVYEEFRQKVLSQAVDALDMALVSGGEQVCFSLSVEYRQVMAVPRPVLLMTDMADWFSPPD